MSHGRAAVVEKPACVVLACGRGTRMGGPKARLLFRGVPLAVAHVQARSADCAPIVVVLRESESLHMSTMLEPARTVISRAPEEHGPAGSIAAALASGHLAGTEWVVITPVDMVPAASETLAALLGARQAGVHAARPSFGGGRGHPVLCRRSTLERAYASDPPPTLRQVLDTLGPACIDVAVRDPAVRSDFDTADAFERVTGEPVRFHGGSDAPTPR